MPPPPSSSKIPAKSQPTPPSSTARTVSSTPLPPSPSPVTSSPSKALVRTPSVTQPPADKSEHDSVTSDAKLVVESASVKQDKDSTQVLPEPNKEQTLDSACESTILKFTTHEQTIRADVLPTDIILRDIANAKETDSKQCLIVQQPEPKAQNKKERSCKPEQHELEDNDSPSNHANVIRINHDKYPSEARILDNKAEIREDRLQVTKANLKDNNEAKNGITKGEFVENEYALEIKTKNMSAPEIPFVYSGRVEAQNNKIEEKDLDHSKLKQSGEESTFEQKSKIETQASQGYGNPAFLSTSDLIKSELKTKPDILDELAHDTCLKTVKITLGTEGATENKVKGAEDLPKNQAIESLIPNVAVEFSAGKDNKKTLQNKLETEHFRIEKRTHQYQANPTGVEESDTFSAGNNISIIDNTKKENIQQHNEVEGIVELKTFNKNYDNRSQIDEICVASKMTERDDMLSVNTQTMAEPSEETALIESVHDKQHSEKVEKSELVESNDIRSEVTSSLTEAKKVQNVSMEKTVTSNVDSLQTVVKKNDTPDAVGDQEFPESREVPEDKKIKHTLNSASINASEAVLSNQRTQLPPFPEVDINYEVQLKKLIKSNDQPVTLAQDFFFTMPDEENEIANGQQRAKAGSVPNKEILNTQSNSYKAFCTLQPVEKPSPPSLVASKQGKESSSEEVQSPCSQERNQDGTKPFIKPKDIEKFGQVSVCGKITGREKC